jgi:hypothetical protein
MTVKEIYKETQDTLIGIIKDAVKANGGSVAVKVDCGEKRCHNDVWTEYIEKVTDRPTELDDENDKSAHGIYYCRDYCYDTPIEKLNDISILFELARQCELSLNKA